MVGEDVQIPAGGTVLGGRLHLPAVNAGVVIVADGGQGEDEARGPRSDLVTSILKPAGLGTPVVGPPAPRDAPVRADAGGIDLLARRPTVAAAWLHQQPRSMSFGAGCCGVYAGAAATLWPAGEPGASEGAAGLVRDRFTRHLAPAQGRTEEASR